MKQHVPAETLQIKQDGRLWKRYTCSFTGPDGRYGFDIYALSHDHAELMLADLKRTAVVDGEVCGTVE